MSIIIVGCIDILASSWDLYLLLGDVPLFGHLHGIGWCKVDRHLMFGILYMITLKLYYDSISDHCQ